MKVKENGGPAFPVVETDPVMGTRADAGMSLLDYFAGQALMGFLASNRFGHDTVLAHKAYDVAGRMIEERAARIAEMET